MIGLIGLMLWISNVVHAQKKPNVVLIMTDDQGYGDLGASEALVSLQPETAYDILLEQLILAPASRQTALAQILCSTSEGTERLLGAIESGQASAALLRDSIIRQQIGEDHPRLTALIDQLPDPSAELPALIAARHEGFHEADRSTDRGQVVFQTQCAVCHSINREGGKLGPNLDGIQVHGAERILEDILDPNRNVDPAFMLTTIRTQDGNNVSGIGARSEDGFVVLTDPSGQTHRIPEATISEQIPSHFSMMPAAYGTLIPGNDLFDLVEFLLKDGKTEAETERSQSRRRAGRRPNRR